MNQDKPNSFERSELQPAKSRGRFQSRTYLAEMVLATIGIITPFYGAPGFLMLISPIFLIHGAYRYSRKNDLCGPCPYCKTVQKSVREDGQPTVCRHCHHQLIVQGSELIDLYWHMSKEVVASHVDQNSKAALESRARTIERVGFVIIASALLFWWVKSPGSPSSSSGISDPPSVSSQPVAKDNAFAKKVMAVTICKMAVESGLKSPSSADFPWDIQATGSGTQFSVSSYVEAKNSFNATIRTQFYCEVHQTGADVNARESWKIKVLKIGE